MALGGLGNIWGAAVLPYSDHALAAWPAAVAAELKAAYANVASYMPLSG